MGSIPCIKKGGLLYNYRAIDYYRAILLWKFSQEGSTGRVGCLLLVDLGSILRMSIKPDAIRLLFLLLKLDFYEI